MGARHFMLQTQQYNNSIDKHHVHGINPGVHSCTRPRALSRGNSDTFKFESVAESCASSFLPVNNTTSRSNSGIQGGVAKDDLSKGLDQQDFLDLLADFSISDSNTTLPPDSNSTLPLTRSDSNTSNTSLPLSVVPEIFWDTIAQSPRPQLLKRSSSGQWGSTHSLRTVDIVDIINDVPNSPVHTAVDSEFEKQSPKPCHAIVHTTVGSEFEKQSTKPCDEISKSSTKKVCAAILKQSTKQ